MKTACLPPAPARWFFVACRRLAACWDPFRNWGAVGLLVLLAACTGAPDTAPNPPAVPPAPSLDGPGEPADSLAIRTEALTLARGVAVRRAAEPLDSFLRCILPATCPDGAPDPVRHAWRRSPYGKQVVFHQSDYTDHTAHLFVVDPFWSDTYRVQRFALEGCGDTPRVAALCWDDLDGDGQPELLVLVDCSMRQESTEPDGTVRRWHASAYTTAVYRLVGSGPAGVPTYRPDPTPRPYLDGLETVAAVRHVLAARRAVRGHPLQRTRPTPPTGPSPPRLRGTPRGRSGA